MPMRSMTACDRTLTEGQGRIDCVQPDHAGEGSRTGRLNGPHAPSLGAHLIGQPTQEDIAFLSGGR
ncbi:MAG TPA: hypothetical protein VHV57_07575 [Acidimicrobiales bacterium]|nr:hypothetical protein [Acidimicrobiales bacterium]